MSGFVALYNSDGRPVAQGELLGAMRATTRVVPEDVEIWIDGNVGLGIVFNRTTAEARFDRLIPAATEGRIVIAADARIDNREELARAFGCRVGEHADSALIALAYEKWGDGCLDHLIGDFSFALWDVRAKRLFAARDHIGVKPFYYHAGAGHFAAASSMPALISALPNPSLALDECRIAQYLVGSFDDVERTFYQHAKRLAPSAMLAIDGSGLTQRRYATLEPRPTIRLASDAEYAEAFAEHFTEAVRCRMRSVGPIGAALSGGLDSSSVVCVARALAGGSGAGPLHTYSIVFDDVPESDERPYIEAVLAGGGVEPHFVRGDRTPPIRDIVPLGSSFHGPLYAPNIALHWEMFKAAREAGVRVWLDGLDGDTTVSHGVGLLNELARSMRWARLYREGSAFAARQGVAPGRLIRRTMMNPLLDPLRRARTASAPSPGSAWSGMAINPELARRYWPNGIPEPPRPRTAAADHLRRLEWGLHPFLLEGLERAACGLELRYPFYDRRLIQFSLALPPGQKLRDGWTRWILRRAMHGILPDAITWRTGKGNPGPSFMRTLREFESERLRAMVSRNASRLEPYLNIAVLRTYADRFLAGTVVESEVMELWKALTFAMWLLNDRDSWPSGDEGAPGRH